MGALFSKTPKSRITHQDKAILQLKRQRDQLTQYQRRIENDIERERVVAKTLLQAGKKEKALLILRKKRYQEQQLDKADGMLENIEKMTQDIEFAQVEIKVIDGLKAGNVALKQLNELLSIEQIELIMDETKEGIAKQQEIDEILHGQLSTEDEEAVMAELDDLLAKEGEEVLLNLPDVPMNEPIIPVSEKKEKSKKIALEAS